MIRKEFQTICCNVKLAKFKHNSFHLISPMLPDLDIHKPKSKHSTKAQGIALLFEAAAEVIALQPFSKKKCNSSKQKARWCYYADFMVTTR